MVKINLNKTTNSNFGQSLFEVVLAVAVIALIVISIVAASTSSIRNASFARNKALATRFAQEAVEWLRGQRDANWVIFQQNATSSSTYCLDFLAWGNVGNCGTTEQIPGTILARQVVFSGVLPASVSAAVNVSWSDSQGSHQVTTSTIFTDWRSK